MSLITPPTKRAAPAPGGDFAALKKLRGEEDRSTRHDVTRYTWWSSHEGSATASDRTFPTKRMALLYVAKRNCEELTAFAEASGKRWENLFPAEGPYALTPNAVFNLPKFLEMSDDEIEVWANSVCDAFARFKVDKGSSYRYAPRESEEMEAEELMRVLKRDKPTQEEMDHHKRQALLLSDIAGFD